MTKEERYKNLAYRFAAVLWDFHDTCPQCGNNKEGHFESCKRTYEKLTSPLKSEEVFDEAFPEGKDH